MTGAKRRKTMRRRSRARPRSKRRHNFIGAAIQPIKSLLARLRSALESFAGRISRQSFTDAPLDEVSAGFLRCVASGDLPLLRSRLASSVREVTPDGLAQMINALSAQPVEIVARLLAQARTHPPF
jgi:hypothetical protein